MSAFKDPRRPVDPNLSWQAQREKWNREGMCAQRACHNRHDGRKHPQTGLLYCNRTADAIEKAGYGDFAVKLPAAAGRTTFSEPEVREAVADFARCKLWCGATCKNACGKAKP